LHISPRNIRLSILRKVKLAAVPVGTAKYCLARRFQVKIIVGNDQPYPAQQLSLATSFSKASAASLSPSTLVR
jgi:hypothetical protein